MKTFAFLLALAPLFAAQAQTQIPGEVQSAPVAAPVATKPAIDPAAAALLDQSAIAYAKLDGLSMHFSAFDREGTKTTNSSGDIAFSRPGLAKVTGKAGAQTVMCVSDGSKVSHQAGPLRFQSRYATDIGAIQTVFADIPSALTLVLPTLVAGENPLGIEGVRWQKVALLEGNGVSMTTRLSAKASLTLRLYFDPADQLLRRVEAQMGEKGSQNLNLTTISSLQSNPTFAPDDFQFTLPVGAKIDLEKPNFDPKLQVGADPFPLSGRDLAGKTHDLGKYAGKVVLLDFWATWSDPNLAEIPNILQNLKNYRESGFEVLGISLDEDKSALQAFVKAHDLDYPQIFDGKGWHNADARKYGIIAIPFSLLIGKDGKIAAVNPRGKRLEPAIVRALAQ